MDIKLNYFEKGEGFPLILLHGNGESLEYFSSQIEFFSKYYRVIAVDTRGHGKSPRGNAPFTLEQFACDISDFLDEMKIEKAHILGFSDGGNIAVIFAVTHPEKIEKLILNGANLYPSGVKLSSQLPIIAGWALLCFISLFDKRAKSKKEMLELMVTQPHINPDSLKNFNFPVLVAVGSHDLIKNSHSKMIADSIPGSEFCIIEGNHFAAAENSEEFNKKIFDFLKKNQ